MIIVGAVTASWLVDCQDSWAARNGEEISVFQMYIMITTSLQGNHPVSAHPEVLLGFSNVSAWWRSELGKDTPGRYLASASLAHL